MRGKNKSMLLCLTMEYSIILSVTMVMIRHPYYLSRDTFATGVNFAIVANMNENNDYTINATMKSRIVKSTSPVMSLCGDETCVECCKSWFACLGTIVLDWKGGQCLHYTDYFQVAELINQSSELQQNNVIFFAT